MAIRNKQPRLGQTAGRQTQRRRSGAPHQGGDLLIVLTIMLLMVGVATLVFAAVQAYVGFETLLRLTAH